jgi:hypothetical protein
VILVPSAAKKHANSEPTTPPPSTAMRFGWFESSSASWLVITRSPSSLKSGGTQALAPEATMMWSAVSSAFPPSLSAMTTRFGPASLAVPRTISTWRPCSSVLTPPVSCFTTFCLRSSIQPQLTRGSPTSMPNSFARRICSSRCAETIHALVGMQPQLRHVPPSSSFSTTAVLSPSCAARIAAT